MAHVKTSQLKFITFDDALQANNDIKSQATEEPISSWTMLKVLQYSKYKMEAIKNI